jgi:hypothetical protein
MLYKEKLLQKRENNGEKERRIPLSVSIEKLLEIKYDGTTI